MSGDRPRRKRERTQKANRALSRKGQENPSEQLSQNANTPWAEKALSIVRRALFPPVPVIACAIPAICAMMAWVFLLGNESSPCPTLPTRHRRTCSQRSSYGPYATLPATAFAS